MVTGIERVMQSRAYRAGQAAPPWVAVVHGVADAESSGLVTDPYDMETDPIGARWMPYSALILDNYDLNDSLVVQVGRTVVVDDGEYQVPPQSQLMLAQQRIVTLAIRRPDTASYRLTLRRDHQLQELG